MTNAPSILVRLGGSNPSWIADSLDTTAVGRGHTRGSKSSVSHDLNQHLTQNKNNPNRNQTPARTARSLWSTTKSLPSSIKLSTFSFSSCNIIGHELVGQSVGRSCKEKCCGQVHVVAGNTA